VPSPDIRPQPGDRDALSITGRAPQQDRRSHARSPSPVRLLIAVLLEVSSAAWASDHPRLLLTPADLPRLRHQAGVAGPLTETPLPAWGRFGARSADLNAMRRCFSAHIDDDTLPGEALAAAFLQLLDPQDPVATTWRKIVTKALADAGWLASDPLESVIALDWCWSELDPAVRREYLLNARPRLQPLTSADSPLEPQIFRQKLAALALAVAVDEADEPSPSWIELRKHLLAAGQAYLTTTLPAFVAARTLTPTSPAAAPVEECNTSLAIEIGSLVVGRDLWPEYRASVGRWLEHYLLAQTGDPGLQYNFMRDDGSGAPLSPAAQWADLQPLTAHLIAARTADPVASELAAQLATQLEDAQPPARAALWRWVPLLLDISKTPRCDPGRLPAARNLGGAVILRGGKGPDTTLVWIDAAQPFLRRRQHFDAGHFLIRRGGELVVEGGDDVLFEALPSKGGSQHLGSDRSFDFEQYYTASIAHNVVVLWDAARMSRWYDERYLPAGGQRLIENTCTDFVTSLAAQRRQTGRQLAYGQHEGMAYLALDLAPAYENRAIAGFTRQFVFVGGRALIVLDRLKLPRGRGVPTWVLNIPGRPRVDDADLSDEQRVAGTNSAGGIWRYDTAARLHWSERAGTLWFYPSLPTPRSLRIVGGPARKCVVAEGRHSGRTYLGGDPDSFERLIIPAGRPGAANAWYRLGCPSLLGPQFGQPPHWGRIELEPLERSQEVTFLCLLVTDQAAAGRPPTARWQADADSLTVQVVLDSEQALVRLGDNVESGGQIEIRGARRLTWSLPTDVQPDPPLATLPESAPTSSHPRAPAAPP